MRTEPNPTQPEPFSSQRVNLMGMTLAQLQQLCEAEGFPRYAARQICDWVYAKQVSAIDAMTNLSLAVRRRLSEVACIERTAPVSEQVSADGTRKYLFPVADGRYVEAVYIPDERDEGSVRATLCISTQCGCRMACRFCVTGRQGFHGSLTASQILNQIFSIPYFNSLTNVVYMGMGEPLDNYDALLASLQVLTSPWGLGWSPKRITVSTVGVTPRLQQLLADSACHVAVSLHSAVAAQRAELMPAERMYPIADVVSLLRQHDWGGQRRISFEYTMLAGLNDDLTHAKALVALLRELRCRVNLIRYHASPEAPYRTSSAAAIEAFRRYLNAHGILCTLRASRGEDIQAACGLLAGQGLRRADTPSNHQNL